MAEHETIQLHQLTELGISQGKALFQIECCVWCMNEQEHGNGTVLEAREGESNSLHPVVWDDAAINIPAILNSIDADDAAQFGAEAIALVLGILKSDYNSVRRSYKGGGYDYWLGYREGLLFQERVRLEISGIRKETRSNSIKARVKKKLEQISQSDGVYLGCVIIVEFNKFLAQIVWKQ